MKKRILAITSALLAITFLFTALPVSAAVAESEAIGSEVSLDDNMSVSSNNTLGKMIEEEIGAEQEEQESNNGINVLSVEVEGNIATAEVETTRSATLIVGIYSEDGSEMYASGETVITPQDDKVQVNIDNGTVPQYFYLKAYIVDTETLKPLCTVYESPNYTREMQEFLSKTTDDFEQNRVLNFDESEDNNFAVYDDSVELIESSDEANKMLSADDENGVYIIENADDSILSLTEGQILSYEYGNSESVVIIKVKSISVDGTTATIEGDKIELEEVFKYFRIDTENTETAYSPEGMSDSLEYVGDEADENGKTDNPLGAGVDYEGELKKTHEFNFLDLGSEKEGPFGKFNVKGGFEYSFGFKMKVYIMPDEKYVELKLEAEGSFDLKFTYKAMGKFKEKADIPIGKIIAPLIPAVVTVSISPSFVCEVSGELELKGKITTGFTFKVSSQTGAEFKTEKPKFTPEIKVEATIFIGLDLKPELDVLMGVFSIDVTAKLGAEVSAEMKWTSDDDSLQHDCSVCLSGEIYFKAELSGKVKFMKIFDSMTRPHYEEETNAGLSAKLMDLKIKIADYYYSADYGEFGFTTCPHKRYKLDITVYDIAGKPLGGAQVSVSNTSGSLTTDSSGRAKCYLPNGDYTVTAADSNNNTAQNTVKIYGKSNGVLINFNSTGGSTNPHSGGEVINPGTNYAGEVIDVEAGGNHSAALTRDGTLYMWGANSYGQLGEGSTASRKYAIKINSVTALPEHSVKQVSLGGAHSAALTFDGTLYMWGRNSNGQVGDGTRTNVYHPKKIMNNVKMVACGNEHSAAVTADGSLYMWGANGSGQLGDGTGYVLLTPVKIMDNVKYVALGSNYSAAITTDNSLYTWGANHNGQLGDGTTTNTNRPGKIMSNIRSVSLSKTGSHSAAIDLDDTLFCWGDNGYGKIGDGTRTKRYSPVRVATNTVLVDLGYSHTVALSADGALYTWGEPGYGRLGNGNTSFVCLSPARRMDNIVSAAAGGYHTLALTTDGRVLSCGYNTSGELGNGSTAHYATLGEIEISDHTPKLTASVGDKSGGSVGAGTTKTAFFNGYKPNSVYNFYSMKNKEDGLQGDNLLYISQIMTDSNGSVTVTYTGTDICDNPAEFLESFEAVDVSDLTIEGESEFTYNGFEQYYQPVLKNGSYELCEGIDYTLGGVYSATDAGEYIVEITGKGVYTGKRNISFTIAPYDIADVTVDGEDQQTYSGKAITPELTLTDENRTLVENTDYTLRYQDNTEAGVAIAEITGTGNYTGRKVFYFDINKCDIKQQAVVELEELTAYTGNPITPSVKLTVKGSVLEKDRDYTISYHNNVNIGIGVIDIKGVGCCDGRIVCWFDITERDLGEAGYCTSIKYQSYTGEERNPEPVVIYNGKTLVKDVDYTVGYSNNTDVGEAKIVITGIGNFSGTLTTEFEIIDTLVGDVNGDGYIDVLDATLVQKYSVDKASLNDEQIFVGDLNDDGNADILDATLIQKYAAEKITEFPKKS